AVLGQLGDTFGFVNALFTGLALAGLVQTALLQQHQLAEQRKEIKAQLETAQENRAALLRQGRAEFLTARLNATIGLLNACHARNEQLPDVPAFGIREDRH